MATKWMKYLGIKLLKEAKKLYSEKYKILIKAIKVHKQMKRYTMFLDWKNQYCENNYTAQRNLQIQCNLYQITNVIFHRIRKKTHFQCVWKPKMPWVAKANLRKKNSARRIMLPDFRLHCKATVIKTACTGTKEKYRSIEYDRKLRVNPTQP